MSSWRTSHRCPLSVILLTYILLVTPFPSPLLHLVSSVPLWSSLPASHLNIPPLSSSLSLYHLFPHPSPPPFVPCSFPPPLCSFLIRLLLLSITSLLLSYFLLFFLSYLFPFISSITSSLSPLPPFSASFPFTFSLLF